MDTTKKIEYWNDKMYSDVAKQVMDRGLPLSRESATQAYIMVSGLPPGPDSINPWRVRKIQEKIEQIGREIDIAQASRLETAMEQKKHGFTMDILVKGIVTEAVTAALEIQKAQLLGAFQTMLQRQRAAFTAELSAKLDPLLKELGVASTPAPEEIKAPTLVEVTLDPGKPEVHVRRRKVLVYGVTAAQRKLVEDALVTHQLQNGTWKDVKVEFQSAFQGTDHVRANYDAILYLGHFMAAPGVKEINLHTPKPIRVEGGGSALAPEVVKACIDLQVAAELDRTVR